MQFFFPGTFFRSFKFIIIFLALTVLGVIWRLALSDYIKVYIFPINENISKKASVIASSIAFKFKVNMFTGKFLLGVSGCIFPHRNILLFIRMNRFRGINTEQPDLLIFSVILYDNCISVNNSNKFVLTGKRIAGMATKKRDRK